MPIKQCKTVMYKLLNACLKKIFKYKHCNAQNIRVKENKTEKWGKNIETEKNAEKKVMK